jgi:phage-related protein
LLTYNMPAPAEPSRRPLNWVSGSKKSLDGVPEDVKDVFGAALLDVQYGDTPAGAKPFGEGLPREIWKIVDDFDGNTYRAVYTAAFPEAVYVLDVFMKKSKSGIGTPRIDKERVRERFNAAKRHYEQTYGKRGAK